MDAVKAPKVEHTDIKIATREGIVNLMDKARNTEYFEIFYLAIFTAMRRSEILGLRWGDVDFIEGKIFVKRSLHNLEGGIVDI
jgi:integrase